MVFDVVVAGDSSSGAVSGEPSSGAAPAFDVEAFRAALSTQLGVDVSQIVVVVSDDTITASVRVAEDEASAVQDAYQQLDVATLSGQLGVEVVASAAVPVVQFLVLHVPPSTPPPPIMDGRSTPAPPPASPPKDHVTFFGATISGVDETGFLVIISCLIVGMLQLIFLLCCLCNRRRFKDVDAALLREKSNGTVVADPDRDGAHRLSKADRKRAQAIEALKEEYRAAGFSTVTF